MAIVDDIAGLRRILGRSRTIAVVGLSANWYRPSYFAAKYLQDHGYRVIPVNPNYTEVLGERCYPSVSAIPEPVDVVDGFRKPAEMVALAREAVAKTGQRAVDAARDPPRRSGAHRERSRARRGDGPLHEDRARAHPRRAQLGGRQYRCHLVAPSTYVDARTRTGVVPRGGNPVSFVHAESRRWVPACAGTTANAQSAQRGRLSSHHARPRLRIRHAVPARRARSPTRRPARARCRSTRRRRSSSTAPTTRRACSTCRRSATSTRGSAIRPSRRSRSAWRRWRAAARRSPRRPAWPRRWSRCSRSRRRVTTSSSARTLYGGTYTQFAVTFAQFGIETHVRRSGRPGGVPRGAQAQHEGDLRGDDRQSADQRLRPRRAWPRSRTTRACRWSWTTRWPRRTCAGRSSTAPTSSCIR